MADMDLSDLMKNTGLLPTQKQVYSGNLLEYAEAMRKVAGEPDAWDWDKTRNDLREPMVEDIAGNILAGHHRFIAAAMAKITIPDGVIRIVPTPTSRPVRPWGSVIVLAGRRF